MRILLGVEDQSKFFKNGSKSEFYKISISLAIESEKILDPEFVLSKPLPLSIIRMIMTMMY
jgi:hypothetical protein